MRELDIIYYYDYENEIVEPYIYEKGIHNQERYMMQEINQCIKDTCLSYNQKQELRKKVSFAHYGDLFRKGYSYQLMTNFLDNKYYEAVNAGRARIVQDALALEREILTASFGEYCNNPEMEGIESMYNSRDLYIGNYDFLSQLSGKKVRTPRYF